MATEGRGSAGGAAMAAGDEFQESVAAYFLALMLRRFDVSAILDLPVAAVVERVAFERGAAVDDIQLTVTTNEVYVQAKRSPSLSKDLESDFGSAIVQFVRQHVASSKSYFVLAIATDASRRVAKDLTKLLRNMRQNPTGRDPLSKSEADVLTRFSALVRAASTEVRGNEFSDTEFAAFVDRLRIVRFDVEPGGADERAAITLCATVPALEIAPQLLWDHLLRIASRSAADRGSVEREALTRMIEKWTGDPDTVSTPARDLLLQLGSDETLAVARDFVLTVLDNAPTRAALMELGRFEADGTRRTRFVGGEITLKNGMHGRLIARASTQAGLVRLIESRGTGGAEEVVVFDGPDQRSRENEPAALAHMSRLRSILGARAPLRCPRCGDAVSEAEVEVVEVDEEGEPTDIGPVHSRCLRPAHRVVGTLRIPFFSEHSKLVGFDFETWARQIRRGMGLFRSFKSGLPPAAVLGWNGTTIYGSSLPYCIRIMSGDGDVQYVTHRMRVQRFSRQDGESHRRMFETGLAAGNAAGDPWVISSESGAVAPASIVARLAPLEDATAITGVELVEYTAGIGEAFSNVDNYYAPVLVVRLPKGLLYLSDHLVLLTDPLVFDRYLKNWHDGGIDLAGYRVETVAADSDFDAILRTATSADRCGIFDPVLDRQMRLVGGVPIRALPASEDPSYV